MPYLRNSLVSKLHWVDDKEFVELLSISQSLPGLNATNMAVLLGDRLKGWMGAVAGVIGNVPAGSGDHADCRHALSDQGRPRIDSPTC